MLLPLLLVCSFLFTLCYSFSFVLLLFLGMNRFPLYYCCAVYGYNLPFEEKKGPSLLPSRYILQRTATKKKRTEVPSKWWLSFKGSFLESFSNFLFLALVYFYVFNWFMHIIIALWKKIVFINILRAIFLAKLDTFDFFSVVHYSKQMTRPYFLKK